MSYRDLPTNSLYPNDTHVIREVTLQRYIIVNSDGTRARRSEYPDRHTAEQWATKEQSIEPLEMKRYILVDPNKHRRSYWCLTKDQCEDYAVAYAPDNRPDFGHDEYNHA